MNRMITTCKKKVWNSKLFFILLLVGAIYLTYLALTAKVSLGVPYFRIHRIDVHPNTTNQQISSVNIKKNRTTILEELSEQLKINLATVQNHPCSNTIALYCGHSDTCGLGCQLHHRIACMIISYSLDIPLIHNKEYGWVYEDPWEKYLKRIGSNCTTSSVAKFIDLDWFHLTCDGPFNICLENGIPMPKEFVQVLGENHKEPYLWLLGQFSNFVFQPNEEAIERIEKFKTSLGISAQNLNGSPLIGLHVRRTDKYIKETNVKLNASDFMNAANVFRNENSIDPKKQITIFIATEDCDVITEFRSNYESPSWKFVTGCVKTCSDPSSRKTEFFEIIRDIQVLVDSDYVICTYSSNICRLVLELRSKNSQDEKPTSHLKSLGGRYFFQLYKSIIGERINPI